MQRLPITPSYLLKQISSRPLSLKAAYPLRSRYITPQTQTPHFRIRTYATMSTQSHACCTVPPIVDDGYKEKGKWIQSDGLKTYHTGSSSAKSGILIIYDIFGFFPQTLQGADILASGDHEKPYQVFMPGMLLSPLSHHPSH